MTLVVGGLIRDRVPELRVYLRHLQHLDAGGHALSWVFVMDNCAPETHALVATTFPEFWRIPVDDGGPAYRRDATSRHYARLARLRNLLRRVVLERGSDGLISIDSDIVAPPDLLLRLLEPGRPWVAALVDNSRGAGRAYNVMRMAAGPPERLWREPLNRQDGGPAELIGAACFYRRDLLERAAFLEDGHPEDVGFARQALAAGIAGWYLPLELEHLMTETQTAAHLATCTLCAGVGDHRSVDMAASGRGPGRRTP